MIEWITISLPWPSSEGWKYLQGALSLWLLASGLAVSIVCACIAMDEVKSASAHLRLSHQGHKWARGGSKLLSTWRDEVSLWGACVVFGPVALAFGLAWLFFLVVVSEDQMMVGIVRRRRQWLESYLGRKP